MLSPNFKILSGLLIALTLFSVSCGDNTNVNELNSELVLPPAELELEDAYVGYEKSYLFSVSAKGELPLNFQAQIFSRAQIFQLTPGVGAIPANGSIPITISVTPDRLGTFEAILIIQTDATLGQPAARVNLSLNAKLPPDCEDGNGCTLNRFDPLSQQCETEFREGSCDDRNLCTEEDKCISGECIGEVITCDDNDFCTDNVCNPTVGCVFPPTRSCDDNNPCTIDRCIASSGCEYENVENGTLCDDFEVCTTADVCVAGVCRGINIPDGTPCDDGDPCSKNEVCTDGQCIDDSYTPPDFLDIKFETTIENLHHQASQNPIIDSAGNIILGTQLGAVALDICGDVLWRNDNIGASFWKEASSLPGVLYLPLQDAIVSVDTVSGEEISRVPATTLTSSTSTVGASLVIQNMVVSGAGNLLISLYDSHVDTTLIHELDPIAMQSHEVDRFAGYRSYQLAVTANEELIATFVSTTTTSSATQQREELFIKYDLRNRGITWTSTSSTLLERPGSLIPGVGSHLYSSGGFIYDTVSSSISSVFGRGSAMQKNPNHGGVSVDRDRIIWLEQQTSGMMTDSAFRVISTSTQGDIVWERELSGNITECFPAIGRFGDIFIGTTKGELVGLRRDGTDLLSYASDVGNMSSMATNPTLSPQGVLVFSSDNKVVGIQIFSGLARSAWPRFRHDNLSSGHQ
ncbi:MAG: hypothetical protein VYC39_05895 [Myxococcota bacterium]|nr:hypothetical protein [Myxococcota bacterium]